MGAMFWALLRETVGALVDEARSGRRTAAWLRSVAEDMDRFNAGPCGAHAVYQRKFVQCCRPGGHDGAHEVKISGVTFELVDASTPQYPNEMVLGAVVRVELDRG
jgi:hypothetical protein